MGEITAVMIFEVLGSPKGHVEKTLKDLMERLKEQVHVKKYNVFEAKEVEKLWSSFAEIELEAKSLTDLMGICFDYMPSSVDIVKPENISIECKEFGELLNDMMAKLHRIDMLVKQIRAENIMMKREKK